KMIVKKIKPTRGKSNRDKKSQTKRKKSNWAEKSQIKAHYSWDGASLRYKGRLVLPQSTDLQQAVFYELHASPSAGHSGFLKTYERARRNFFWQGMKRTIQQMVADDDTFQVNKGETTLLSGLLKPVAIPTQLWPTISMDFLAALWWYNTTSQRTPYEAVYGKTPPVLLPYTLSSSPVQEIDSVLR
ncbi:integrase zinc binding domain-containing protein, partial [Poseidonibacter antarcticus]|uniref:integrase zinc binding domain-containing protein n=1 Tax=Poseidonibacter antarcticus TaxID=2478538 RepID=UPI0013CE406C